MPAPRCWRAHFHLLLSVRRSRCWLQLPVPLQCFILASSALPSSCVFCSSFFCCLQVVVPLQCINNLAIIILDETTPAAQSWFT